MELRNAARTALLVGAMALAGCGVTPDQEAAAIERGILETPGAEVLWQTIKAEYPDDFAKLVSQIQALDDAERANDQQLEGIGAAWLQDFFARITPDAVKAPAEPLLIWSKTEGELYATLQRSAEEQCAAMTMGEWIFIDDANTAATAAIARRNAAIVRASAAGRANPQVYSEPDDAAFNALGDAIAATGLEPELQAALGSDAAMQALAPEDQCAIGVAVYTAVSDLPDDSEPAMAAYMLAPE